MAYWRTCPRAWKAPIPFNTLSVSLEQMKWPGCFSSILHCVRHLVQMLSSRFFLVVTLTRYIKQYYNRLELLTVFIMVVWANSYLMMIAISFEFLLYFFFPEFYAKCFPILSCLITVLSVDIINSKTQVGKRKLA